LSRVASIKIKTLDLSLQIVLGVHWQWDLEPWLEALGAHVRCHEMLKLVRADRPRIPAYQETLESSEGAPEDDTRLQGTSIGVWPMGESPDLAAEKLHLGRSFSKALRGFALRLRDV